MDDRETEIREWSHLPDDLKMTILVRLPAHDLLRYKLVSKLWLSWISSADFISGHSKRSKSGLSNRALLCQVSHPYLRSDYCPPRTVRSIAYFLAPGMVGVGSANGLICVVTAYSNPSDDIWIMNPVTGHIMKLPLPEKSLSVKTHLFESGGIGYGYFAFWWDSKGDGDGEGEYKVAKIVPKKDYAVATVASVWVSGSPETWTKIPVGFDGACHHPAELVSGCDAVVGDFAYWIVLKYFNPFEVEDVYVLSLNMKTLSLMLNEIPFPRHYNVPYSLNSRLKKLVEHGQNYLFAANWKGNFVLVERVIGPTVYDVWTMDVVSGCWSKVCSFDIPILKRISDVNGKTVVILESGMALYDIGTGETEVVEDFIIGHLMFSVLDFVGSFVSIKGFKPLEAAAAEDFRVFWPNPSASRTSGKCVEGDDEEEEIDEAI